MLRRFLLSGLVAVAHAGTVSLPSYPLAVKSPYLSTWVPGDEITNAPTAQPVFWAGQNVTWPVLARINNNLYTLFGRPAGVSGAAAATTSGVAYTSSHTYIYLTAGGVDFTLDFFSPVLPGTSEYAQQSLPYSYLTVSANTTSSTKASVQVFTGIDYTWTAQEGASHLNYTSTGSAGFFWWYNPNQIEFTEVDNQATYGSILFGANTSSTTTTFGCQTASTLYSTFKSSGSLSGTSNCGAKSLGAVAVNLGSISSTTEASATFFVGFERGYEINYLGVPQVGYHQSQWSTIASAVTEVLSSYTTFVSKALILDQDVRSKSEAASADWGSQYADIVEASVRQTFGAIELTVPYNDLTATPQVFLKEISSDGNVNTVDVIYQSWPIFISLNPYYIRYLFQPILTYLETGDWPESYVVHDLGSAYPNATGHDNGVDESMPLFETSTLFILLYAYQKYTNDTAWAAQYTSLLEGYGSYLVENSLYPASQLISVDAIAATANQTALAIQSTIGIQAAYEVLGNSTYQTVAQEYAEKIYNDALGLNAATVAESTHFTYNYGVDETWNVVFTAFSDVLLGLDTFPSAAWELQSTWYLEQIQEYGLPFAGPVSDTSYTGTGIEWGLSDWNIVAAAASSAAVQAEVVNTTHVFLTDGKNSVPFGTKYYVEGSDAGVWIGNDARSTVGSNFAILALNEGYWGTSL